MKIFVNVLHKLDIIVCLVYKRTDIVKILEGCIFLISAKEVLVPPLESYRSTSM